MSIPRFTADNTIYPSSGNYRQRSGQVSVSAREPVVQLQDCGFFEGLVCAGGVAGAIAICADACVVTGGLACYGCITGALAVLGIGGCADCIPTQYLPSGGSNGSGGGGSGGGGINRECCERDPRTGRCTLYKPPGGECP
jgi:hypothetical protein